MWNPFARPGPGEGAAAGTHLPRAGSVPALDPRPNTFSTNADSQLPTAPPGPVAQVETMGGGGGAGGAAGVAGAGGVSVVTLLVDELTFQRGAPELADLLEELVDNGCRRIVLDIQNVRFMDSACVGCIVEALNTIARAGGRIALANAAGGVAHVFRLTRLDRVFPICADVMAAVNAVEREREGE